MLGDQYEFEYRSDHLYCVTLGYVFHSMGLSCFLLRAFIFFSWLDPSFHFAILFLHCTPITGSVPYFCWILDSIFDSMLIFSLRKGEKHIFHIHTFFERFTLITLLLFLLWSSSWRLIQRYMFIDGVLISWLRVFHTFLYVGLLMEILWSHLQPSHSGHLYDLRVSVIFPVLDCHHRTIYQMMCCTFDLGHLFICASWSLWLDLS